MDKTMPEYTDKTAEDGILREWIESHCSYPQATVIVSHGTREQATVNPRDLVNSQGHLPDGRLVRVSLVSPQHAGDKQGVFVTAEAP